MSKKELTLLALLIAVVAILIWLFSARQPDVGNTVGVEQPTPPLPATSFEQIPAVSSNAKPDSVVSVMERIQQLRLDPKWDWKRSIRFYGKVVDEKGQPIQGVTANINWSNAEGEGNSKTIVSDENGLFSLLDERGKSIQVRLHHPSYYNSTNNPISFEYADVSSRFFHRPQRTSPVIFRLKQRGKAEPLLAGQKLFGFKPDGTKHYLDFKTQKNRLTPPGDLTVSFLRGERNSEGRYDWSATLSVPTGGIVESVEELQFTAPADGYEESVVISQRADAPDWTSRSKKQFFFKTGQNGQFGRMEVTLISKYNDLAAMDLSFFLNPTGSRNLEFDSAVQPKPTVFE